MKQMLNKTSYQVIKFHGKEIRKFFVYFELNRISNIPLFQARTAHITLV